MMTAKFPLEPAMAVIDLTDGSFDDVVAKHDIVVVDFWAPWCGPCKGFAPVFESASERHPDVVFGRVNTDEQQELAGAFSIRSIPTVMLLREQVIVYSQAGALPAHGLDSVIAQAKALDMKQVHAEIAEQQAQQQAQC
jgi:thioredoxin 1